MPYTEINVTMELISSMVVAILLFSQVVKKKKTRLDILFLIMLSVHLICTLSDAVNWAFDGKQGAVFRMLTVSGNFLSYAVSAFAYPPFLYYVMTTAKKVGRKLLYAAGAISVLMVMLSVLNLFNGMFYTIDHNNVFRWGKWDGLFNIFVFVQLLLPLIQILRSRKVLEREQTITFMAYEILPILAIFLSLIPIELTLVYPATMLSLLLLYVNVQQEQENRLVRQEAELSENRMAIMISQIQPHFLFNALTAAANLCVKEPVEAQRAITDFAKYLRGNMQALTQRQPISFTDELRHIRYYLNLEQMRFGKKLNIVMEIGPIDFLVPALTVQPILENAIKHGVSSRENGGTVVLRTEETPDAWRIIVKDDGIGFNSAQVEGEGKEHIGIINVRSRLAAMVGGGLEIRSVEGVGTVAEFTLPKELNKYSILKK